MSWNYRVIEEDVFYTNVRTGEEEICKQFSVREVYYDDNGNIEFWDKDSDNVLVWVTKLLQ